MSSTNQLFRDVAEKLYILEKTTGRNDIVASLVKLFEGISEDELVMLLDMLVGKLTTKIAMAKNQIIEAVRLHTCLGEEDCKVLAAGDMPEFDMPELEVEENALTITSLYDALCGMCIKGTKSSKAKRDKFIELLRLVKTPQEFKYVVRILIGKLRCGVSITTAVQALAELSAAKSVKASNKAMRKIHIAKVKEVYSINSDIEQLARHVAKGADFMALEQRPEPGKALKPMLATTSTGISATLRKAGALCALVEWKYDGIRAQVHRLPGGTVKVFSRNLEDQTERFGADVNVEIFSQLKEDEGAILDCEVVAVHKDTRKVMPFQTITNKVRPSNVVPIFVVFDILYWQRRALEDLPFTERREIMNKVLCPVEHNSKLVEQSESFICKDPAALGVVERCMGDAVAAGCEGLMLKGINGRYDVSKRSKAWIKLKKDHVGTQTADTIDVVVVGAFMGDGKRAGMFGSFLVAIKETIGDITRYQTLSKVGTGMSDEFLTQVTEQLKAHECTEQQWNVEVDCIKSMKPEIFLMPRTVWELKFADITTSPSHRAAYGRAVPMLGITLTRGLSLRFPRLLRERPDKKASEVTTAEQLVEMYGNQAACKNEQEGYEALEEINEEGADFDPSMEYLDNVQKVECTGEPGEHSEPSAKRRKIE